tara:strand:- start:2245 stop:3801 length:1557 start_codon:yes stop_codon:yes gene_type:complete
MVQLLGFQITRSTDQEKPAEAKQAFTVATPDDGTTTISAGGYFGQYLDMEVNAKNDFDLIRRYREIAQHPECDMAVEDIINEVIVSDERDSAVSISLDKLDISDNIKTKIRDEFYEVLGLMNFDEKGHDIFKRWYIDGRIYFHKVIDPKSPRKGLTELRYIDPRKIKKVREVTKARDSKGKGIEVVEQTAEWFVYNEKGMSSANSNAGLKISTDSICYVTSGVVDATKNMVMGHLHKAIKPVNQLRMIEDAVVIYRIVRAPERRIFYVDVGNLPKVKAESYLRDVMARYRNKLVYDASTGEIRDDRKHMSMLEDFWLPRRDGTKGTEVSTLPGGQNLGEISDVQYFQKKLYKSLNVPISRMESENGFNVGRSAEITRDELKFTKFVQRLRKRFTQVFHDILKTQLVLKGIITIEDWSKIKEHIQYDYLKDGYFSELKNAEILRERLSLANEVSPYIGKFYSVEYVRKYVLRQSDEDIIEIDNQIAKEIKTGIIAPPQGETLDDTTNDSDINIDNIGDE